MKKIPSVFKRDYEGNRQVYNEVVLGCEWVLKGEGVPTEKVDGTACMIRGGVLYKRYDCKKGRTPPKCWEPCEAEPDEHTGHWPGWAPVGDGPEDEHHRIGLSNNKKFGAPTSDGTYELVGPKVQGNPYNLDFIRLIRHGKREVGPIHDDNTDFSTFEGIRDWLAKHEIEGIVWHHPDGRMAKIKRRDFGFEWPIKA